MRTLATLTATAALLLLAGTAALCPAQDEPGSSRPVTVLEVQDHSVHMPVTVRDKHGNLVTNLTAGDLTLTQDGRPQKIQSLTLHGGLPFRVGLVVETSPGMMGIIDTERKALSAFVDQMLPESPGTGDEDARVFLIHFDHEVELLRDFTDARAKLQSELDGLGPTPGQRLDPQGPETTGDERNRPRGGVHNSAQLYDAIYLAASELMRPQHGRKVLVVLASGVDQGSRETLSEAIDAADHANLTIYTVFVKGQAMREQSEFPGTGRRGGLGGIWPGGGGGYPGGGYPGGGRIPDRQQQADGRKTMQDIASRTGGRYFEVKRREDLNAIYRQIAEELHSQYLLTFTPDKIDNDGGYQKVEIKAKDADMKVLTRAGYYPPEKQ